MSAHQTIMTPGEGGNVVDEREQTGSDADLEQKVIAALQTVYDPEIPVNIHELGLIYDLHINAEGEVYITMTLTTPGCPVAGSLPGQVEQAAKQVPGVKDARVELVWDPPWSVERMTDEAKLTLGLL